jgi:hypothetical protein
VIKTAVLMGSVEDQFMGVNLGLTGEGLHTYGAG